MNTSSWEVVLAQGKQGFAFLSIYVYHLDLYVGNTPIASNRRLVLRCREGVCVFLLHIVVVVVVVVVVVDDSHIQRIVLATEETTGPNKSTIDLSNANPACGYKEVPS